MNDIKTYAVINQQSNIVDNVILWDGVSDWRPPVGFYVQSLEGTEAGIGWTYTSGKFIDTRPVPEPEPDPEQGGV